MQDMNMGKTVCPYVQGSGLGLDILVSRWSHDISMSHLSFVSTKIVNVSVLGGWRLVVFLVHLHLVPETIFGLMVQAEIIKFKW